MLENAHRKIILISILLVAAALLLIIPDRPMRMGLDLAGGTRLVYSLPIEEARKSGQVGADETDDAIVADTIAIFRNRIDPTGVLDPIIRNAGSNRIEIQLPGVADLTTVGAKGNLTAAISVGESEGLSLSTENATELAGFPGGGGVIKIGAERIRYEQRVGNRLLDLTRGFERTPQTEHAEGEAVALVSDDAIRNAIENLGDLQFYIAARPGDFQALGTDEEAERAKVRAWLEQPVNKGASLAIYNALPREQDGPPEGIRWFPQALEEGAAAIPVAERLFALKQPPEKWLFRGEDLESVTRTQDQTGYPAVGFTMKPSRRNAFGEYTEEHKKEPMAIVLNDEIVSMATIDEALYGHAQIHGRFTATQVESLVRVLRSGSLKIKPELQTQERVGATLGGEYVRRCFLSGIVSLLCVVAYMVAYYRRLGVLAVVALLCNLLLLLGGMVALKATLTLPGIAGIILTVGMAVDANILVFERIREEQEKGHKVVQASINGFKNAMSAILDANITTIITALILMKLGTGPVAGFAVTLIVGILTSLFAALVIVRVLVHLQLEKRASTFTMARWLAEPNYDFLSKTKIAVSGSLLVIVAGVAFFLYLPDSKKLGIDFLGGASVKIRTEDPQETNAVRALVAQIPGSIGESSDVAALPASSAPGGYRQFRISFKTDPNAPPVMHSEATFEGEIRRGLEPILQRGPIELGVVDDRAQIVLYFEEDQRLDDVRATLEQADLTELELAQREGRSDVFTASAKVATGTDPATLRTRLRTAFESRADSGGDAMTLAEPIPETTVVGGQVVGELRDSAILAILFSLAAVIFYLQLRFAKYSYGIATVVAVAHDVLVTLAAIGVMVAFPLVSVEINLPMIAAFLTIVGYQINDTIVLFDRVRENLPRMKGTLTEIVNVSINQTLSRTITTTGTVLLTLIVLFAFSVGTGSVLEGFSFAMIIGMISGTYSTIFIASPVFLWLENRSRRKAELDESKAPQREAQASATS
jgi:SecD/SecF fusion protein